MIFIFQAALCKVLLYWLILHLLIIFIYHQMEKWRRKYHHLNFKISKYKITLNACFSYYAFHVSIKTKLNITFIKQISPPVHPSSHVLVKGKYLLQRVSTTTYNAVYHIQGLCIEYCFTGSLIEKNVYKSVWVKSQHNICVYLISIVFPTKILKTKIVKP